MAGRLPKESIEVTLYMQGKTHEGYSWKPSREDYHYMDIALDEAEEAANEGNPAVGATFVAPSTSSRQGFVVSAHSTERTTSDLRNHAEMLAYGKAQPLIGRDLSSVAAYTTAEPCGMCGHIFEQGHIGKLVIAASRADAPEFFRQRALNLHEKLLDSGRTILVVRGIRKARAIKLLTQENNTAR